MGIFVSLFIGWSLAIIAQCIDDDCCPEKEVGGVIYNLVALDPAAIKPPFNCKNPCVYSSEKDGNRYCFEIGNLETECIAPLLYLEEDSTSINTSGFHQDGVLMMGGIVNSTEYSGNVELLGSCNISTKALAQGIQCGAAALGEENRPYICGGIKSGNLAVRDCHIGGGMWDDGPLMETPRAYFSLNRVGSYLVAVGGDKNGTEYLNTYELLDVKGKSSWEQTPNYTISTTRGYHCAVTISSSKLMVIGGFNGSKYLNSVEILDITTGESSNCTCLPEPVSGHQCTIYNGKIFLTGGYAIVNSAGYGYISNKVYSLYFSGDLSSSPWIRCESMIYARNYHVAAIIGGLLTVYSGHGPGMMYMEKLINGTWSPSSLTSDRNTRYWSAYTVFSC